jgi:predicted metal-binding membrane protein
VGALESVLKRDRAVVAGSLLLLVLLAWAYLLHVRGAMMGTSGGIAGMSRMSSMADMPGMAEMPGMSGSAAAPGPDALAGLIRFALTALMWIVMMVGMMLPSAAPMILLFAALERRRPASRIYSRTSLFVLGYVLVWSAFSLAAATLETGLQSLGLVSAEIATTNALLGGALFVAAGIYEWSPLKRRCLTRCRSPLMFLTRQMRPSDLGALQMGAAHGVYCLGCCWVLMLLLFVGGVMNLLWVAVLAAIVLAQKLIPVARVADNLGGAALILCGLVIAARPF